MASRYFHLPDAFVVTPRHPSTVFYYTIICSVTEIVANGYGILKS
jgi:hypothetical protein